MMYATFLAQAALIASVLLCGIPPATGQQAEGRPSPQVAANPLPGGEQLIARENGKLRCRLYFGCVPSAHVAVNSAHAE